MSRAAESGDVLRTLAPQILGVLVRRYGTGRFDLCEDAVQEALLAAHQQWPVQGQPDDPRAWLVTTAKRRFIDRIRSEKRRRDGEIAQAALAHPPASRSAGNVDDSLELIKLCCHPALPGVAQIALTLRAVAGLTTFQIAHAHLLPEATVAQRITRAKARIREGGATFPPPSGAQDRLGPVLTVLYLMFNEGYTSTTGPAVHDVEPSGEAIRLAGMVCAGLPGHAEAAGLLAPRLLTDARRAARTTPGGTLVPLDEQERSLWNLQAIGEGEEILRRTLPGRRPGPYLRQASIAALHDEAPSTEETDWPRILILYKILERETGNPVVTLNRAVAEAMVHGPAAGLALVGQLSGSGLPADLHRLLAVRAPAGDGRKPAGSRRGVPGRRPGNRVHPRARLRAPQSTKVRGIGHSMTCQGG